MKKIGACVWPIASVFFLCLLALLNVRIPSIPDFGFLWDVFLGIAAGFLLRVLPRLCGQCTEKKKSPKLCWWISVFLLLVLILCQYLAAALDIRMPLLSVLECPTPRLRITEGLLLSFSFSCAVKK